VPGLVSLPRLPTLHPDQNRASTAGTAQSTTTSSMRPITVRCYPSRPEQGHTTQPVAGSFLAIERLKGDTSVATLRLVGPRHRPVACWAFQDLSSANSAASSKVLSGHPAPVRPGQEGHHVGDVGGLSDPAERTHTWQRGEVIGTVGAAKQVGVGGAG
jgi:hypothetical protein